MPGWTTWLTSGVAAVTLHGVMWSVLTAPITSRTPNPASQSAPMQVRVMAAQRHAGHAAPQASPDAEAARPAPPPRQEHTAASHDVAPPTVVMPPPPAKATGDDYLPRHELTRAPMAQGVVQIPYPEGVPDGQVHKARLALYIDETGAVRRVRVINGSDLPPPMEEAARLSFLQASFTPGERHGQSVKSYILIEVEFDASQRTPAPQQVAARS